jgi:membrane fusion protein, multidrug efflux system
LLIGAIGLAWYWYTTWRWLESTDDAYTQADNTAIVPRVSGYISELLVTDNQRVKAGQVLIVSTRATTRRRSIRRRPM